MMSQKYVVPSHKKFCPPRNLWIGATVVFGRTWMTSYQIIMMIGGTWSWVSFIKVEIVNHYTTQSWSWYGRSVPKIEEIFQVISINVIRWEHSPMTWKTSGFWNCDTPYWIKKSWSNVVTKGSRIPGKWLYYLFLSAKFDITSRKPCVPNKHEFWRGEGVRGLFVLMTWMTS